MAGLTKSVQCAKVNAMTLYATNKRASFDYEIGDKLEAGVQFSGHETKAIRHGLANITSSFVILRGGEAYLVNAHIAPFQPANTPPGFNEERPRKLLLRKKELNRLIGISKQKGLTILPLRLYNKGDKIKLEIGIGRGRRKYEKRELLKKRTHQREMEREGVQGFDR